MCVKLPLGDLNSFFFPPHLTNTYTCGVTIVPKVCGGVFAFFFNMPLWVKPYLLLFFDYNSTVLIFDYYYSRTQTGFRT